MFKSTKIIFTDGLAPYIKFNNSFSLFLLTDNVSYFPAFEHVSIKLSFLFKGGVSGEGAVAMTAFVLAALAECKCQGVVCR